MNDQCKTDKNVSGRWVYGHYAMLLSIVTILWSPGEGGWPPSLPKYTLVHLKLALHISYFISPL